MAGLPSGQLGRYEILAPEPLPAGPRVTNPAAPLLRLLLRAFNVVLAAAALLMIGSALWMGQQYRRGDSGGGGGDAPSPAPDAAPGFGGGGVAAAAAARVASFPWFIYAVGGAGAYCFATALCGLAGVKRGRRGRLAAHIVLLAGLMLAEAGATLLLLTDNAWRARIPDDPSGRWAQAQAFVQANARGCRLAAVATLGAELAALAAACWLHAIYTAAYEAWLDDREEQTERTREMLNRAVVQTYAGGSGSSWQSRMRSKYGFDASSLEAATNAARQTAALRVDDPQ
ncbi:hypothetical protein ABPG75_005690 [Micractinium tetrahymenae]